MNILNQISTGLSVVIFAACCAAFLLFGVSGMGWKAFTIPTGSMRPGMPPGSLALVHRVPDRSLKVGDVITYDNPLRPDTTLSHRIIKKVLIDGKVSGFITKGDANKVADVPFVAGAVVGKVVWHVRYVGYLLLWLKTWTGIAVLVYTPAALIVIEEVLRLNAYYKSIEPYRLFGYRFVPEEEPNTRARKFAIGASTALAVMFVAGAVAPQVYALLTSNIVTLTKNTISVAAATSGGGNQCSRNTDNSNNVNVNDTSTQTATSGNASSSGNTAGESATSGSASNSNSTTVSVTVSDCK